MSIFQETVPKYIENKWLGNSSNYNNWTVKNCTNPAIFIQNSGLCQNIALNENFAYDLCNNITDCKGFDFDPNSTTVYFRTSYDMNNLTDKPGFITGTTITQTKWSNVIILIAIILTVILVFVLIVVLIKKEKK